jgi:adenylate kinase family enzyme
MSVEKISAKKPVSILYRDLSFSPKTLFAHLAKGAFSAVFLDGKGVQNNLLDLVKDVGLKDDEGQVAYALVFNAFNRALIDIIREFSDLFTEDSEDIAEQKIAEAAEQFEQAVSDIKLEIDADFFSNPKDISFLNDIESALCIWLEASGAGATEAKTLYLRVKERFVLSLHEEWLASPNDYAILEGIFDSPFTQSKNEHIAWQHYRNWLIEQPKARLFEEPFGLDKVYVPLRAYYKIEKETTKEDRLEHLSSKETESHVVALHDDMHRWLNDADAENAVRIITGGPGSGKSTFAKVFAAEIAEQFPDIQVIFVPLQHFALESDLVTAMENFIKQEPFLSGSPLNNNTGDTRLLMIFDGLDELASQSKLAEETARDFIDELIRNVDYANQRGQQRQAFVTSRDITAQTCSSRFRKQGQYLHVLPYFYDEEEDKGEAKANQVIDPQSLLKEDQRDRWWQNYGNAKGIEYQCLPRALATKSLQPITQEPLLNYLVALSYERNEIDFAKGTTLNEIYEDLLKAVFDRKYESSEHQGVKNLDFDKFTMVLEAIAIAVWHGHGRTASEKHIADYCEQRGLSPYLEDYKEGNKKGLNRLLTAFYFRESDKSQNDQKTFEFTHKSFGEYLIARCVFKELQGHQVQLERAEKNPRDGKDTLSVLKEWAELCGPTAIDQYLNSFIQDEARRKYINVEALQQMLAKLLSQVINHSLPMEKTGLSDFKKMLLQDRNAEEALMVFHSACARVTDKVSELTLDSDTKFGTWLRRIQLQRDGEQTQPVLACLNHLDIGITSLHMADLYQADLYRSDLSNAGFYSANLEKANLGRTNLQRANLQYAKLEGANLEGIKLYEANLHGARISQSQKRRVEIYKGSIVGYDEINFV